MNDSAQSDSERPSTLGTFLRGALSGAMSGGLMSGIVAFISTAIAAESLFIGGGALLAAFGSTALMMIPATALFAGIMAVKHVMFDSHSSQHSHQATRETIIPVPVQGMSAPTIAPSMDAAPDAPSAPTQSWVEQTGRDTESQTRIQQILNNGAINDKARAEAILASRDATSNQHAVRG